MASNASHQTPQLRLMRHTSTDSIFSSITQRPIAATTPPNLPPWTTTVREPVTVKEPVTRVCISPTRIRLSRPNLRTTATKQTKKKPAGTKLSLQTPPPDLRRPTVSARSSRLQSQRTPRVALLGATIHIPTHAIQPRQGPVDRLPPTVQKVWTPTKTGRAMPTAFRITISASMPTMPRPTIPPPPLSSRHIPSKVSCR